MLQRAFRTRMSPGFWIILCIVALQLTGAETGLALDPDPVLILANRKAGHSLGPAEYYRSRILTYNMHSVF